MAGLSFFLILFLSLILSFLDPAEFRWSVVNGLYWETKAWWGRMLFSRLKRCRRSFLIRIYLIFLWRHSLILQPVHIRQSD